MRWFYFFFSSRRRHTRCSRDWSSDVCSSDLAVLLDSSREVVRRAVPALRALAGAPEGTKLVWATAASGDYPVYVEIGRASCRERVSISVAAVLLETNCVSWFSFMLNVSY